MAFDYPYVAIQGGLAPPNNDIYAIVNVHLTGPWVTLGLVEADLYQVIQDYLATLDGVVSVTTQKSEVVTSTL